MWFKEALRIWGEYAFLAGKGRDGGAFWENMCPQENGLGSDSPGPTSARSEKTQVVLGQGSGTL